MEAADDVDRGQHDDGDVLMTAMFSDGNKKMIYYYKTPPG